VCRGVVGLLLLGLMPLCAVAQLRATVDSLKGRLGQAEALDRIAVLNELCWTYRMIDADSARQYGFEALALAEALDDLRGLAAAHNNLGVAYEAQDAYDEALRHHLQALSYKRRLGDSLEVANTYTNIGVVLDKRGQYKEALEQYYRALAIYESLNDSSRVAMALVNTAIVHKKQGDYDLVLANYERALALYAALDDAFGQAACYANLGSVSLDTGAYEDALRYARQSVAAFEVLGVRQFVPYGLATAGIAQLRLGRWDEAEGLLQRALEGHRDFDTAKEAAFVLRHLAELALARNRPHPARAYAVESLREARRVDAREEVKEAYRLLAVTAERLGDYRSALRHQKRFTALKDSLYEIEKTRQIAELRTIYETEKKERQIAMLDQERRAQALALQRNRILIGGLGFGIVLLLLLGLGWRKGVALAQQHALDQQRLQLKEAQLRAVIAAQENERRRIARDLHDGIGQQLGGLKMAWQHLSGQVKGQVPALESRFHDLSRILDAAGADVRTLSHQMMPRALRAAGLVPAMTDMLAQSFRHRPPTVTFDHFGVENRRFGDDLELGIYRISQELVNNILRHAEANVVAAQLYVTDDHLILRVEDDGRGVSLDPCGVSFEQGSGGHGLANIQSRAEMMGARFSVESEPGRGFTATVRVPLFPVSEA